ncbi:MAG: hypothetical protein DRH08_13570, partial [Deltaproteobacteria bacterium]
MVDNVNITEGTGKTVSTDEVTRTVVGEQMQIVKLGLGNDGVFDNLVAAGDQVEATSIPVVRSSNAATFEALT